MGPLQKVPETIEFSFYDSRRGFFFVFSDYKPEGRFAIMTDELMGEMSDSERAWYDAACFAVNARWVAAHEAESAEEVERFLSQFKDELKREAEKTKGTDDGRDEDCGPGEIVSPAGD